MAKKVNSKTKTTKTTRSARTTRPNVVSFRITAAQTKLLDENFKRSEATGVRSTNQFARKVLCDHLAGRLDYRNPADKLQDFDTVGA